MAILHSSYKPSPRASEEAAAERTVAEACDAEKNGCQEEMAVFVLFAEQRALTIH